MHKRLGKITAAQTQKCIFNYWHGKCELMKTLTHDSQRWQEYKRATRATRTKLAPLHVYSDTKHVRSLHSDEEVADEMAAAFSARHSVNQDHYRGNQARLERVDAATNAATHSVRKRLHETNLAYTDQIEKGVCAEDVRKIIGKLRSSKAGGVDGVKARVITTLKEPLSQVLADVANWSVATAYWPSKWKLALVSPLAKTDVPRSGSDFRPVSLLPLLSKVVESSVEKMFQAWCVEEETIPKEQDGCVRGCDGHLQRVYTKARRAIRNKNHSALLPFDMAGAFDCVWHKALLYKLLLLDAPRQLVLWLSHYLHERRCQLKVGEAKSLMWTAERGAPQGAVLSPLPWNVFLNDVLRSTNLETLLFADGVAVHSVIKRAQSTEEAAAQIQTQLSAVNDHCLEWWLSLSVAKTKLTAFSNSRLTLEAWDQVELSAGGSKVEVTRTARHLGVTFDSRLLFNNHFDKSMSRASRRLKQLLRHGSRLNAAPLRFQVLLHQLCMRSVLEDGSHIYGFASPSQLKRLDRFQANALKQTLRVHKTTNNAAVEVYCNCEPLELRRLATWANKALNRTLDKDSTALKTNPTDPTHRALPAEVHGTALQRLGLDPGATVLDLRDEILKCEGWEALNECVMTHPNHHS